MSLTPSSSAARQGTATSGTVPLLYHELREQPGAYTYAMAQAQFTQSLSVLSELPPSAWRPQITFDDGHRSDYERAMPALQTAGMDAIFFITTAWTGQRAGFMSRAELRALSAAGMQIGAHGMTHTLLTQCTPAQLRQELVDSRAFLEDTLGMPVTQMSLPGGRSHAAVLRAATEAGYTRVWTSTPGVAAAGTFLLPRFNVRSTFPVESLKVLMDPRSGMLHRARRTQRMKSLAQRILGDRAYAILWRRLNGQQSIEADGSAAVKGDAAEDLQR